MQMIRIILITVTLIISVSFSQAADLSEKYDLNTEVQLEGEISDVIDQDKGPKIFILNSAKRTYQLHTGPWWYLEESGIELKKGDRIEVTGSKTYDREGNLVLIIYNLKHMGEEKVFKFRDSNMRPLWRGGGRGPGGGGRRR